MAMPQQHLAQPLVYDAGALGWRSRAACRFIDPNFFFPVGSSEAAREQAEAAKSFCRSCVVRRSCLEFAVATNQEDGIWGGRDESERRRLRREWRSSGSIARPVGA
jgi:WhiB family redox-sensing transcriptional regulator